MGRKGEAEIEGLTDVAIPRRLGPKRANKIRRMFLLPKHSDNLHKKGDKKKDVTVDKFDVCRYVVKRPSKAVGDKQYYKAPKIQRLVTSVRRRRKKQYQADRVAKCMNSQKLYSDYVESLKG